MSDRARLPLVAAGDANDQWAAGLAIATSGIGDIVVIGRDNGARVTKALSEVKATITGSGQHDGTGNSVVRPTSNSRIGNGNFNTVAIGNHNGASVSSGPALQGPGSAPVPAFFTTLPAPIAVANAIGTIGQVRGGDTDMVLNVRNSGNGDGTSNQVILGSSNRGGLDGNLDNVSIGENNGVGISFTDSDVDSGRHSGLRLSQDQPGPSGSPQALVSSALTTAPASHSGPPINVIFESLQITITDSGNDNGDDNGASVGSFNSGDYNGNGNSLVIGSGNGVSIAALNSAHSRLLSQLVRVNVSGSGNNDGGSNLVASGSWNSSSANGNGNAVSIGDSNGVMISAGGSRGGGNAASASAAASAGQLSDFGPNTADLGTFAYAGISAPIHVLSQAASLALDGYGNEAAGLNGSFNGNDNSITIGSFNGANISVGLGSGFLTGDPGDDLVSESVLINVVNSGNNNGNGNFVSVGNLNGPDMSSASLLAKPSWSPSVLAAQSLAGLASSPGWSDFSLSNVLQDFAGKTPITPVNLVFESIGITVLGSGNNNGNLNGAVIGSQNGGGHNGNGNAITIGNDNGVAIYI